MQALAQRLEQENVQHLHVTSQGALSKYQPTDHARAIFAQKHPPVGDSYVLPLSDATRLFERYADNTVLERIYVARDQAERVGRWLVQLRPHR